MNPFVSRNTPRQDQWIWPITAMCLVLGFMISLAWVSDRNRDTRYNLLNTTQQGRVSAATVDYQQYKEQQTEINKLREENTKLQNTLAQGTGASKILNDSLQEAKLFAGLTAVEGPGVMVTLRDSSRGGIKIGDGSQVFTPDTNIHDLDVLRIANELFAAGAEAISVNDHRIAGPSSIRCVGPTILVNDVKIASPVTIKAIGDPQTLLGAMNLNGGVLSEIRTSDPNMVQIEAEHLMKLDPFSGRTNFRLAKVPKEAK